GRGHAARDRQGVRGRGRRRPRLARGPGRRVRRPGRALGLRQDDDAEPRRRAARADRWRHPDRRQADQRPGPQRPRPGDGLPELCALPEQEGLRQPRLPAQDAGHAQGGDRRPGPQDCRDPQHRAPARPEAEAALRRPAAARRPRPGPGPQPQGLPDGRAALQPGRQAARPDAGGAEAVPPGDRRDGPLRHPRPDGSGDDGRQDGGDERRGAPAVRPAGRGLPPPGERVRRRVRRQPVDEPAPSRRDRRRRPGRAAGYRGLAAPPLAGQCPAGGGQLRRRDGGDPPQPGPSLPGGAAGLGRDPGLHRRADRRPDLRPSPAGRTAPGRERRRRVAGRARRPGLGRVRPGLPPPLRRPDRAGAAAGGRGGVRGDGRVGAGDGHGGI
ncbi:MAG: Maltose/maltodextrin transport ATP-binding protein MalK, partial [uncultured Thermomicrobiales bacterium]